MTQYTHEQEKIHFALSQIKNMQPYLCVLLASKYFNKPKIVDFAKFFIDYWDLNGGIIFRNEKQNFDELVERKYQEWIKIMEFDKFEMIFRAAIN